MKAGLTRTQWQALDFLREFSSERGYAPSYQEIANHLGLASKSGVSRIVHALKERGYVSFLDNRARAIVIEGPSINLPIELFMTIRRAARQVDMTAEDLIESALRQHFGVHPFTPCPVSRELPARSADMTQQQTERAVSQRVGESRR